ncbi:DUF2231 domain-containing protein [Gordonia bronchialis]|uniref:DUF2231 domain-containing protein n=1 Tax=Gordonia bronchialis TaxID=2054 RepID=UPI00242B3BC9|nr:DUF2231 domain-containing protein [Gordonia bronchialis]
MGFTTINGLPAHVLFVHFVVVLVPLTAALVAFSVAWPAARRRIGAAAPGCALVTLILVVVTANAGEWLKARTPPDPLVRVHAELGDQLVYWSASVLVVSVVWWLMHADRVPGVPGRFTARIRAGSAHRMVNVAVAVAVMILAVGSCIEVYRIGDSGATAVWHDQLTGETGGRG